MSNMRQYLYTLRATRTEMLESSPTPEEAKIIAQHAAYLERLADQGMVVLSGRTRDTDESSFGIVIFNAESEETAYEVMRHDPAVKYGVMRAELHPYQVAFIAES